VVTQLGEFEMGQCVSIKMRLYISGFILISVIIIGLTFLTYHQYYDSQIKKIEIHAKAIISPFHELIRQELPDTAKYMNLYLKVALLAKESSQLPLLLHTYHNLEGLCFFDTKGRKLLCHGNVNKYSLNKGVHYVSNQQIQVIVPFEVDSKKYATTLLAFSSKEFEKEKLQILTNGGLFFIVFMTIGFFGVMLIGRSITRHRKVSTTY